MVLNFLVIKSLDKNRIRFSIESSRFLILKQVFVAIFTHSASVTLFYSLAIPVYTMK